MTKYKVNIEVRPVFEASYDVEAKSTNEAGDIACERAVEEWENEILWDQHYVNEVLNFLLRKVPKLSIIENKE